MARPAEILAVLPQLLTGRTRVPLRELVDELRSAGVRLPKGVSDATDVVLEALDESVDRWHFDLYDRLSDPNALLDGGTLTHRLGDEEIRTGRLQLGLDFPPTALAHLEGSPLRLPDGRAVRLDVDRLEFTLAPTTWSDLSREAGDLIGIAYSEGSARLMNVDDVADDRPVVAEAVERLKGRIPLLLGQLVEELLLDSDLYREPRAPLGEILRREGFAVVGGLVSTSDEEIVDTSVELLAEDLSEDFGLNPQEGRSLAEVVELIRLIEEDLAQGPSHEYRTADPTETPAELDGVSRYLEARGVTLSDVLATVRDPWLAETAARVSLDQTAPFALGLAGLVNLLTPVAKAGSRGERASLEYLHGRCQEFAGDPLAAEASFRRALALAPEHEAAMIGLAGIAVDRADIDVARSLLDRAGAGAQHALRAAIGAAEQDGPSAPERLPGRNEPCWCGSGRKFKVCHARSSASTLPGRMRTLPSRVMAWRSLNDPGLVQRLVAEALVHGGETAVPQMIELLSDVIVMEEEGLADYLDRRGPLLVDDEAMTAAQWLLRPRSLFEVEQVTPGEGMLLRDLVTGDRHHVKERSASRQLTAGTMLVTRIAPIGDGDVIFGGGIPILLHERSRFIDLLSGKPTAEEIVAAVAERFREPTVATTEGDLLLFVEGTLTTTSPRRLRDALDAAFTSTDDGWQLDEPGIVGGQRVLATLRLQGRTLTVETMSEARYERVLAILDELDVPLVERSCEVSDPMDSVTDGGHAGDSPAPRSLDPSDPQVREVMTSLIAQYESEWLDESIPALDGFTPRAAAADATHRQDLIRLLDTFPSSGSPLEMDGSRLKAALGL